MHPTCLTSAPSLSLETSGRQKRQAYFVSRNEILSFLNGLLDMNLTKIEETASGAVACQLTEYIFPGSVPMSKVNWGGAFVLGDVSATDRAPAYFRRGHSFSHPARMTMTIHMVRSTLLCLSNPGVGETAKASHEYVANYKLLQSAFRKHKVQRYVE